MEQIKLSKGIVYLLITTFSLFSIENLASRHLESTSQLHQITLLLIVIMTVAVLFYIKKAISLEIASLTIILTSFGFAIQSILNMDFAKLTIILTLSILTCVAVYILFEKFANKIIQKPLLIAKLSFIAIVFLYAFLILFAPKISGVKAWIFIFGVSFQLTEVIKVLYIVFTVAILSSQLNTFKKFGYCSGTLVITFLFSVLINEFGTFSIFIIIHLIATFILLKLKYTVINILALLVGVFIVIQCIIIAEGYINTYKENILEEDKLTFENNMNKNILPSEQVKFLENYVYDYDSSLQKEYIKEYKEELTQNFVDTHQVELPTILGKIDSIITKLGERIMLCSSFDYIKSEKYDKSFQSYKAQVALLNAGPFGSTGKLNVPIAESDMVFVSCAYYFGLVYSSLIILLFLFMFVIGINIALKNRDNKIFFALSVMFSVNLFMQSIIMVLANVNILPLAGLPMPFLTISSGSSSILSFAQIGALLYFSSNKLSNKKEPKTNDFKKIVRIQEDTN